jgi:DNA-directed RNA polymerase subunit RPC12/RpoP
VKKLNIYEKSETKMISLKNTTNFTKVFSCLCSSCRTEFSVVVEPETTSQAICPNCGSKKIFVQYPEDKGDLLYY